MSNTKTELYLIRHAESTANINGHLIGGRNNNVALTERGVEQSRSLGKYLIQNDIRADFAYTSPSVRTVDTARNSLASFMPSVDLLVDDRLQELDQGEWSGQPRNEIYSGSNLDTINKLGKDFKPIGGESMNDVGRRMLHALTDIAERHTINQNTTRGLIFTHGGSICCLASLIEGWPHDDTYKTIIPNASVSLFTLIDGSWSIEYLARPTAMPQPVSIN